MLLFQAKPLALPVFLITQSSLLTHFSSLFFVSQLDRSTVIVSDRTRRLLHWHLENPGLSWLPTSNPSPASVPNILSNSAMFFRYLFLLPPPIPDHSSRLNSSFPSAWSYSRGTPCSSSTLSLPHQATDSLMEGTLPPSSSHCHHDRRSRSFVDVQ